jgi:hypothetical protein
MLIFQIESLIPGIVIRGVQFDPDYQTDVKRDEAAGLEKPHL